MQIVLIGFMGCGKTTLAQHLSQSQGLSWLEMDALVCQKTHTQNMHEVFAKGEELLLREAEIAIAKEIATQQNVVISTGGGVVLNKIVLDYFKQAGAFVFYLHANFETIVERLRTDRSRPLFQDAIEAKKLYEFRLPLYTHYADHIIDVDTRSVAEICLEMQEIICGL